MEQPLLAVRGLEKHFPVRRASLLARKVVVRAVAGVDLEIMAGETLGLVGESGSGKTTLGRCVLQILRPTAGTVRFRDVDLRSLGRKELRLQRRHFQMVFQDPSSSLNPKMSVGSLLAEPLAVHDIVPKRRRPGEVERLMSEVGLPAVVRDRFPHQLSGGQQQRVGIARALASRPDFVVADEPVSALDTSAQAQIINLLAQLRGQRALALLFIAHDLAVVERLADRVCVLYLGKIVEIGSAREVLSRPLHPYSVALRSAVPQPDPRSGRKRIILPGDPPSALSRPSGCSFHPRCPIASERCRSEQPELLQIASDRMVACHFPGEIRQPS